MADVGVVSSDSRRTPLRSAPRDVHVGHPLRDVLPTVRARLHGIVDTAMHIVVVTDADGNVLWREGNASEVPWAVDVAPLGRDARGPTDSPWPGATAPVHDPETGKVLGVIAVGGPLHLVHPALKQLVTAVAELAENELRLRLAVAEDRFRARNMPHLANLRGSVGALVTATGRIVACEPFDGWPERVHVPEGADRVRLDDGRTMIVERLAEGYLLHAPHRDGSVPRRSALSLRLMGETTSVLLNGRSIPITLRPAEILAVLALHPEGLTAEQLALMLYGDGGNPTTVRGEILRLRNLIGPEVLRTRPYRLDATVDTDFGSVRRALREGNPAEALRLCGGSLLPRSDAPAIRELRDELDAALRRAVLNSADPDLIAAFAEHPSGHDDLEVHDRLTELLPPDDPRLAAVESRRARLLTAG